MDIAHLVSHALAGLTQLSIHRRVCDMKVIRTFYIGERLNGVNKKPISLKNQWKFRACTPTGGWTQAFQALRQPLLWEYSSFRSIFYGNTEMRSGSDCLLVMYWYDPQTHMQLRTTGSKFVVASWVVATLADSETNFTSSWKQLHLLCLLRIGFLNDNFNLNILNITRNNTVDFFCQSCMFL